MNSRDLLKYDFSRVADIDRPRSLLNMSHMLSTTFDAGKLIPIMCEEVYPGDTWTCDVNSFVRLLSPLKTPIIDNIWIDVHFFYVRNQLLWDHWVNMMGEKVSPTDSTEYTTPKIDWSIETGGDYLCESLDIHDYFGMCPGLVNGSVIALPYRAYNQIINDFYRDQDYDQPLVEYKQDEDDPYTAYTLYNRRKRKDYFTSCRPNPQKGDPVSLSIGTSAPVYGTGMTLGLTDSHEKFSIVNNSGWLAVDAYNTAVGSANTNTVPAASNHGIGVVEKGAPGAPNVSGLYADLTEAGQITINALRLGATMQRIMEIDARHGSRYIDHLQGQWGVTSSDQNQYRPIFLGSSRTYVNVNSVPSATRDVANGLYLGSLGGQASGQSQIHAFSQTMEEHGFIIGLASGSSDVRYSRGHRRFWHRNERWDYYVPEMANIGEMAVLNREIYYNNDSNDTNVWGYQEAWADLRQIPNRVTGLLRPMCYLKAPLSSWTTAPNFTSRPALNSSFLADQPEIDRVIYQDTEPHFMADFLFDIRLARVIPMFSIPGVGGRF